MTQSLHYCRQATELAAAIIVVTYCLTHLVEQAAALINAAPDAIVARPELPLQALKHTVPLVGMTEDMVAAGLVKSLAHPGGNTTGISLLSPELDGKRQDILIEMVPTAHRVAAIADGRIAPTFHGPVERTC